MTPLLIVRPQPGADRTRVRAAALGWTAIVAPIFTVAPIAWDAPDPGAHDALMLTSANAVRYAGPALLHYAALPTFAVGGATAQAAAEAGLTDVRIGSGDAAMLVELMMQTGVRRPLHLTGRDHRTDGSAALPIERKIVYTAEPVTELPSAARAAIDADAITLIHSPRAGATFASLTEAAGRPSSDVAIAAISRAAAAGTWRAAAVAETPDDAALLAAAARLCEKR